MRRVTSRKRCESHRSRHFRQNKPAKYVDSLRIGFVRGAYVEKAKTLAILLTPAAASRPAGVFRFGPVFRGVSPPRHPIPMFSLSRRDSGLPNSTTQVRPAPQRQPRELSDSLFDSAKRVNTKERASARFREARPRTRPAVDSET